MSDSNLESPNIHETPRNHKYMKTYGSTKIHESLEMYGVQGIEFALSRGTVVNSQDLTTSTSCVQATHGLSSHSEDRLSGCAVLAKKSRKPLAGLAA